MCSAPRLAIAARKSVGLSPGCSPPEKRCDQAVSDVAGSVAHDMRVARLLALGAVWEAS